VGWMWATELAAAGHEVWVITREANRNSIEADVPCFQSERIHFQYCDLTRWARGWKKLPGAIYLYYFIWQWLAFRLATAKSCAPFRSRSPRQLRQPARAQFHGMARDSLLLRAGLRRGMHSPISTPQHDDTGPSH
jgi:NAD(P)-dependent dehydrogenase (short-subunit alcohol dehydrogenase family)